MEAIIKFNLPEEQHEYAVHCMAGKLHSLLFELIYNKRRDFFKYNTFGLKDGELDGAEKVFDEIFKMMREENINLEE